MEYVFTVTLPIYLGIALGYAVVRAGWMQPLEIRALGKYTVLVGVPALLFRAISHQSLGAVLHVDYLAVYALGSLAAMGLVVLLAWRVLGRSLSLAGLQALGAVGSNSMFIGYPIVLQVIGPSAAVALALCTLVENLLVIPLGLALADAGGTAARQSVPARLGSTLRTAARNPMILAIGAGLAVSALGWQLPAALDKTVSMVAGASSPIALFVIGGSLVGLKLQGIRSDLALIVVGKLVLHPLCVLALLLLFPPADALLRAAALLFAACPMMSIYPVLAQRQGQERLCSAALLAATVLSFFSLGACIAWLPVGWLPLH
jgi:malonate transporter and related proteins